MKNMKKYVKLGLLLVLAAVLGGEPASAAVSYSATIQPIFDAHCTGCHGASFPAAGISLTSYTNVMAATFTIGSITSPIVIPGNAADSILYVSVNGGNASVPSMPLGTPLSATDITSIADWINEGALSAPPAPAPVLTTVTISPTSPNIAAGATQLFTAETLDQNGAHIGAAVAWSSSNAAAGSIDAATGSFTAASPATTQTTTITVTATNGSVSIQNSTTATITPASPPPPPAPVLTTVTISPTSPTIAAGATQLFTAETLDLNGAHIDATVSWSSSNAAAGSIDAATGSFTAASPATTQTTTITVTATNGSVSIQNSTIATVNPASPPPPPAPVLTTVTISPTSPTIAAGATQLFTAETLDQNGVHIDATVSWSSSNAAAGSIDAATGSFTAASPATTQTTTITVTATNGSVSIQNSTIATVNPASPPPPPPPSTSVLTTVIISPATKIVINAENTQQFSVETLDQSGAAIAANVVWSLSNPAAGTIDSNGLFTAAMTMRGRVTEVIATATSQDGTVTIHNSTRVIVKPMRHHHNEMNMHKFKKHAHSDNDEVDEDETAEDEE